MTRYLLIIPFLLSALFSIAQIVTLNQSDTIQNSDIIRCYTMEMDSLSRQNYPDRGTLEEFEQWLAPRLEEYLRDANDPSRAPAPVLTIPVVFHIITDGAGAENLTAAQVQAQVNQMNIDFRNLAGSSNSVAADSEIEFCLATLDPLDNVMVEPGINRVTTYGQGDFSTNYIDNTIKPGTSWDPNNYLNIWSARLSGGLLGWAQFPNNSGLGGLNTNIGAANTDGVVVQYYSVGSVANPNPAGGNYARGRTMTHEVGHWLGLRHIWGDGPCGTDDFCTDTPESSTANYGCPNVTRCSSVDQVQNYMDYTDDACMNIFTSDQKARIRTVMDICPRRASLALSYKCGVVVPAIAFVSGGGTVINEGTDCSFQDVVLDVNISSAPTADATVTFNSSGTATAALDFDLLTTSVVFPAGTTPLRQVTVRIYNDGIIESNETILLSFTVTTTGDAVAASGDLLDHDITVNNDDVSPETGGSVVILNEDFEAGLGAFTTQGAAGSDRFLVGDAANCNSPYWNVGPSNATQFAYSNDDACNCNKNNDRLTSPAFSLAGTYTDAALTFDHAFSDLQTETAEVQISTGGGFTTIATLTNTSVVGGGGAATTPWVNGVTVNLTPYIGSATVQVRFKYDDDGSWFYGMAIDNIEVTADAPVVIQTSVNSLLPTQIEVGPNNEVAFYDNTTGDVMCSINNLNGWDYGCTSVEVDRDATVAGGPSVMFWNGATDSELLAKTFYVDPTINSATGAYSITLYYTDAEVSAWELATGKLRTDLKIIKIQDNPIGVVTPTNYSSYNIEMVPAALGQFGSDVSLTATFSTGFSGFGAGDPSLITCNNPTTPTLSFDADPVCPGGSGTSLNIVGTLNDATAWHIYSTNCGTGPVGNTATGTFAVNPGSTTTYYVRGEGGCVVPGTCIDAELTVNDAVNPTITCPGNVTVTADASTCTASPALGTPTTGDNCSVASTVNDAPANFPVGNTTVTWTATDGSSNSNTCTHLVSITNNLPPQPGTITGATPVCSGDNQTYSITAISGATGYTWSLPSGWTGSSTTNSISVVTGPNAGNVSVTADNACGSSVAQTLAVSLLASPAQPGTISGDPNACVGAIETYSISTVAGATSYSWSLPSGWTGTSSTNSIAVTTGANAGNISVTADNGCGSSTAQTLAVTLQSSPSQPGTISGATTPCSVTSETYSITAVSGANSYNWTLPSGWTGTSTTNSITVTTGSGSGTIDVVAVGACGNSPVQTLSVSPVVLTTQPSAISGLSPACPNSSLSYSVTAVSGAVSYNWVLPSGWTGTSTTNSITVSTTATGGNLSVAAINSCGQVGPSSTLNISVLTVDDGVPCTVDACNPANGNVTHSTDDSYCDDGLWCNGQETCDITNGCEAGTAPTIDDGNGCTDDSCDEVNDVVVNAYNTSPCDDGDPFTANDQCVNGACVGTPLGNVWTGNINSTWGVAGNWSMYIPTSGLDGLIPTTPLGSNFPTIPSGFIADVDNLQVQANATINVQPGATLDVFGVLTNNGTINVDDSGSLLQRTGSTNAGNGTYNISRLGSGGFNYDYWSSPISNQPTVPGVSYLYNSNTSTQDDADDIPSDPGWASYNGAMNQGQGYAARELGLYTFTGTVGNGPINNSLTYYAFDNTYSQTSAGTPFNLVGNPYPSAISASQLVADNPNIDGTIMFWDDDLSSGSGYHRSDYAYWNGTGGLGTGAGIIGAPNGFISSAQGFMVRALNSGNSISFNNNQRVPASNSQFFKMNGEDSRLWFSIEREGSINQILIGMLDDATTSEDRLYDAVKMHTTNSLSIAAIANDFEHAIMAFPPPTESQTVPLLVTANQAGYYLFKANILENFAGYQVFFNDVLSNTSELIEEGTTIERFLNPGEHANRFYLNFSLSTITSLSDYQTETLTAFVFQGTLHLSTNQTESFNSMIELIDARGRTVYINKAQFFSDGKTIIPLPNLNTGMYLVKITSEQWVESKRILLN